MKIKYTPTGFINISQNKTPPPEGVFFIRSYRSNMYRVRNQPEVVKIVADEWPEFKSKIDYDYYKKWCAALYRSKQNLNGKNWWGYEFKLPLYRHQRQGVRFLMGLPAGALFMEPGTGKTATASVVVDMRHQFGKAKKTLIICPKTVMKTSWYDDICKFTHLPYPHMIRKKRMRWTDPATGIKRLKWKEGYPEYLKHNEYKTLEEKLFESNDEVYIVGIEYLRMNYEPFLKAGFDQIVLDESTMIKNPSGKSFEAVRKLGNLAKYRMILTGTPAPNEIGDLWSQMKFLDNSLEDTYGEFVAKYYFIHPKIRHIKNEKKGARRQVLDRVKDRCFYVKKSDCLDLPDRVVIRREVEPPAKIKKHYNELFNEFLTFLDSGHEIEATNPLTLSLRLQQVINGYSTDGDEVHEIEPTGKIKEIQHIVEQAGRKVIVWAVFKHDFRVLKKALKKYNPAVINGATKDSEREDLKFLDDDSCKVMIAHPRSVKFGKTWNVADTTVYYTYGYGLEDYLQSRDRNYRIGQNHKVTEYFLTSGGVENKSCFVVTKAKVKTQLLNGLKMVGRMKKAEDYLNARENSKRYTENVKLKNVRRGMAEHKRILEEIGHVERPRIRAECPSIRPCPFLGCRHHLYIDIKDNGNIQFNFGELDPMSISPSCSLDVADGIEPDGRMSLEDIGNNMGLTRERIRQIQQKAIDRLNIDDL